MAGKIRWAEPWRRARLLPLPRRLPGKPAPQRGPPPLRHRQGAGAEAHRAGHRAGAEAHRAGHRAGAEAHRAGLSAGAEAHRAGLCAGAEAHGAGLPRQGGGGYSIRRGENIDDDDTFVVCVFVMLVSGCQRQQLQRFIADQDWS